MGFLMPTPQIPPLPGLPPTPVIAPPPLTSDRATANAKAKAGFGESLTNENGPTGLTEKATTASKSLLG